MKSILVVSANQDFFDDSFQKTFDDCQIDIQKKMPNLAQALRDGDYDFLLLDLSSLNNLPFDLSGNQIDEIDRILIDQAPTQPLTLAEARKAAVDKLETGYLKKILRHNKGRINKSSEMAGISSRQLRKLLTKYHIQKESFKKKES